jgi:hypothetical protein
VRDTEGYVFASSVWAFGDVEDIQHAIQRPHETNLATPPEKYLVSLIVSSAKAIFAEPWLLSPFFTKPGYLVSAVVKPSAELLM